MNDERVGTLLHDAVRTLDPPTERLVDGGVARGRRRIRLIRGAEVMTGAVVLAGVTALAATALPRGDVHGSGANPAATKTAATTRSTVTMTPQALLRTALDALPRPGSTSQYAGSFMDGFVGTQFVYDDGHGAAQIQVSMQYPQAHPGPHPNEPITPCTTGTEGCRVLADGTHALIRQGYQYQDGRQPNAAEWEVELVRSDGVKIAIYEWNAPKPKDAALTRAEPPFTIPELITWAGDGRFTQRITADYASRTAHLFSAADLSTLDGAVRSARTKPGQKYSSNVRSTLRCAALSTKAAKLPAGCLKH